jgi:hypothetical protein
MCDRDFKLNTGVISGTYEDLKVDLATKDRISWNEISLNGVFKDDPTSGMILCDDQADADVNACLSIWTYQAKHPSTSALIPIDIRGGTLAVDDELSGAIWDHQFYVVLSPDIPAAYGGQVKFFDGYLKPYANGHMRSVNQLATKLDPALWVAPDTTATGSSDGDNTKICAFLYYPKGTKNTHIFRLITYRPNGTA